MPAALRPRLSLAALALAPMVLAALQRPEPAKVSYSRDVEPIFRAHCVSCHGAKSPSEGLSLSTVAGVLHGDASGAVVVPGAPDRSRLLKAVEVHDGKAMMPPGFAPLSAEQIGTIRAWIAQGAKGDAAVTSHWAYLAPVRPPIPEVQRPAWVRNPIDAFVLKRLEGERLAPSSEAAKATLLRRVTLDLVGVPPTPQELDAFLADGRPDAYERAVDRLLASPHYGERRAQGWLDLARYADTDGFADSPRQAWLYRDWVVNAYNRNLPFDRFTAEQLAGDLLPDAGKEHLVATGFGRNTLFDGEVGGDPNEAHLNVLADRASTTATVFLGSTLACARCHDHKYDPFSQRDFYAMTAFFTGTGTKPMLTPEKPGRLLEPLMPMPSARQAALGAKLRASVEATNRTMRVWTPAKRAARDAWRDAVLNPDWRIRTDAMISTQNGTRIALRPDGSYLASEARDREVTRISVPIMAPITGLRLEALPDPSLPEGGAGMSERGGFSIGRIEARLDGRPVEIVASATDSDASGVDRTPDGGPTWMATGGAHELVLAFGRPLGGRRLEIALFQTQSTPKSLLGHFRVSTTGGERPTSWVVSANVRVALAKGDLDGANDAFFASAPLFAKERMAVARASEELAKLDLAVPTAMVLQEGSIKAPLKTPLRIRGEFGSPGPVVEADTPAFLPPMPQGVRKDRLALARWIASKENPLTARVEANRAWMRFFGRGIVVTAEDFGTRGTPPSNPELLDWLATEFVRTGWDMKALDRLIVTSATYRQRSSASPALLERDPKNDLLARGPRVRLDAETIRDATLACGGLLSARVGGPSVFPYQPAEVSEGGNEWTASYGNDACRRSLYTFWDRGSVYPLFQVFDATNRSECTVRRVQTTTPLQALALLNDAGLMAAARGLGMRMLGTSGNDDARLAYGFRVCTSRPPTPPELAPLRTLLARLRAGYRKDPKSATQVASNPERAAWTLVGNVLLNLDETITKG